MRRSLLALVLAACNPPAGDGSGSAGSGGSSDTNAENTATPTTGADTGSDWTMPTGDTSVPDTADAPTPVCPVGDVVLVDQDDVLLHAGCTDFPGDLTIRYEVTDIAPLAGIRTVAGTLTIGTIGWSGSLSTLDPLASLESVGGLDVAMVPIADLLAFSNLTEIPGDLSIFGLDIPSLEGFHNITEVGGEVRISISEVADLTGLRSLQRVGKGLFLGSLAIPDFHGLEALTKLGVAGGEPAFFYVYKLPVTSLADLNFPWHDALDIKLQNTGITDLGALTDVPELHGFELIENNDLADLVGLESLLRIGGVLKIQSNATLVDLDALGGLESIGELQFVGGQAADLEVFTSLHTIGMLFVHGFKGVELPPPPALQTVGAATFLHCQDLAGLAILDGVISLTSLSLDLNDALVDLSALAGLVEVTGDLVIHQNAALATVDDLAALQTVGGRLVAVVNPSLPQAEAVAWGDAIDVGGARKIAGNKDAGPPLDPCPWFQDGECDEPNGGSGICGEDLDGSDCCPGACE